jgi:hypothetical protein
MDIPDRLIDKTTIYRKHTVWTHLFCVLLRIALGISVILNKTSSDFIIWLAYFVIFTFGYKFLYNNNTWKVYGRTMLIYTIVLFFINTNRDISGIFIIIDALMGFQSRHTATIINN